MGKRKIPIKKIEDKNKRNVTFTKRRQGLFKKAAKTCSNLSGIKISILVFSPGGKPYCHGDIDTAIHQFLNCSNPAPTHPHEDDNDLIADHNGGCEDCFFNSGVDGDCGGNGYLVEGGDLYSWPSEDELLPVPVVDDDDDAVKNIFDMLPPLDSSLPLDSSSSTFFIHEAQGDHDLNDLWWPTLTEDHDEWLL